MLGPLLAILHGLGAVTAVHAVLHSRTSQAAFAADVERMLVADFAGARPITKDDYGVDSLTFRLQVRTAYLLAQIM